MEDSLDEKTAALIALQKTVELHRTRPTAGNFGPPHMDALDTATVIHDVPNARGKGAGEGAGGSAGPQEVDLEGSDDDESSIDSPIKV